MKHSILYLSILALSLSVSCKSDKKETTSESNMETETPMSEDATADTTENRKIILPLASKSDTNVSGEVIFTQEEGTVTMIATLNNLTEGEHAIHIHQTADCSSDDGKSSGGHWNPTGQPHGKWGDAAGYHKGDIGNFTADADGNARLTKITDEWCIGCGDDTKDIIGKAIIVHQGVDDFTSQPSGAAGTRVSCGGIIVE